MGEILTEIGSISEASIRAFQDAARKKVGITYNVSAKAEPIVPAAQLPVSGCANAYEDWERLYGLDCGAG